MIVPNKTVAYYPVIPDPGVKPFDMNISTFLKPLNKDHKRDWFTPNFYRCLPLSIGNMQGFAFSVPFDFSVIWTGGLNPEDVIIGNISNLDKDVAEMNHVNIKSEFGHGIFTAHFPVILKTPPEVSLMTIAPPNFPTPGISPMTGVIETDNLKFSFTLNFKIDIPNILINVKKDSPIMGIIPIQRNYCDSFELINAYDIIDKDIIEEERQIVAEHVNRRNKQNIYGEKADLLYFKGMDIRKNKFENSHQLPGKEQ